MEPLSGENILTCPNTTHASSFSFILYEGQKPCNLNPKPYINDQLEERPLIPAPWYVAAGTLPACDLVPAAGLNRKGWGLGLMNYGLGFRNHRV